MTDRELLEQALEALDWAADCIEPLKPINCDCPVCFASNVLRERLAQPEQWEQLYPGMGNPFRPATREEKIVRPGVYEVPVEQEPVATVESKTGNPDILMSWWHEPALPVGTKLYTTPPRREWVGLTDEEKLHLEIMGGKSDVMLAEAIEAKLKEKNNG